MGKLVKRPESGDKKGARIAQNGCSGMWLPAEITIGSLQASSPKGRASGVNSTVKLGAFYHKHMEQTSSPDWGFPKAMRSTLMKNRLGGGYLVNRN